MNLETVREILQAHRDELKTFGVRAVHVFGSVAQGTEAAASDVDLIVELDRPMGLAFFRLKPTFEGWLGCPVDVTTPDGLREDVRDRVLREAVRAA